MSNKRKRSTKSCSFNNEWLKNNLCKDWITKLDDEKAFCKLCSSNFKYIHEGFKAVRDHSNTDTHIKNFNFKKENTIMKLFLDSVNTPEELKVIASEVSNIYHSVKHHHSYRSLDCGMKLNHKLFSDSNICMKTHCGRTKAEAIVENVVCDLSIEKHVNFLLKNNLKFSIAIDAYNKGNIILYPLVIQYFTVSQGIQNFVLDLYDNDKETSFDIYTDIKSILGKYKLELKI